MRLAGKVWRGNFIVAFVRVGRFARRPAASSVAEEIARLQQQLADWNDTTETRCWARLTIVRNESTQRKAGS